MAGGDGGAAAPPFSPPLGGGRGGASVVWRQRRQTELRSGSRSGPAPGAGDGPLRRPRGTMPRGPRRTGPRGTPAGETPCIRDAFAEPWRPKRPGWALGTCQASSGMDAAAAALALGVLWGLGVQVQLA